MNKQTNTKQGHGWSCNTQCAQGVTPDSNIIYKHTRGTDLTHLQTFLDKLKDLQDQYALHLEHCNCCEGPNIVSTTNPDHTLANNINFNQTTNHPTPPKTHPNNPNPPPNPTPKTTKPTTKPTHKPTNQNQTQPPPPPTHQTMYHKQKQTNPNKNARWGSAGSAGTGAR